MPYRSTTLDPTRVDYLIGDEVQGSDVWRTLLTADLGYPDVHYVFPELWTLETHIRCPVVGLDKGLFGHKNNYVYWQEHRYADCLVVGFILMPSEWPCVSDRE